MSSDDELPENVPFKTSKSLILQSFREKAAATSRARKQKRRAQKNSKDESNAEGKDDGHLARLENLRQKAKLATVEEKEETSKEDDVVAENPRIKKFRQDDGEEDESVRKASDGSSAMREVITSNGARFRAQLLAPKGLRKASNVAGSLLRYKQTMLFGAMSRARREDTKKVILRREKMQIITGGKYRK